MSGERKTASQHPRHYDLDVWKDAMRLVREVYRITAVAYGRKGSTMAVLQQTYARQFVKD